jgi:dihydroxyacid dehydratase/phosphogluconate dehydratase
MPTEEQISRLRSRAWFDNPDNVDMTALYLERTMNYGLSLDELQSGRPIIGIAQTGSDITPCNRHHLFLATRVRARRVSEASTAPIRGSADMHTQNYSPYGAGDPSAAAA